jgi:hypothetical protein
VSSTFLINVSELSKDLLNEISRAIGNYTTPLIYNEKLIGSATFIAVDDVYGLLTAYHVADLIHFFRPGKLGINLAEHPHRFEIDLSHLTHLPLAKRAKKQEPEFGPDLSFIRIPESPDLDNIKARKSFYPLRQQLSSALETDGLWMILGHPELQQYDGERTGDFSKVMVFPGFGACSGVERTFEKHGLDIIDLSVDYSGSSEALATFGGVSGGGAWRVPLYREDGDETKTVSYKDFFLCGVAFWESGDNEGSGVLRCQGPHAVYEFVPKEIRSRS